VKERLETHREQALLSKRLVTLNCEAPCPIDLETLKLQKWEEEKLKAILIEFEFNSIGRRLFGDEFKAGRGFQGAPAPTASQSAAEGEGRGEGERAEDLVLTSETEPPLAPTKDLQAHLKKLADTPHQYHLADSPALRHDLIASLLNKNSFCFHAAITSSDPKQARLLGLAFSFAPHTGYYVPLAEDAVEARLILEEF